LYRSHCRNLYYQRETLFFDRKWQKRLGEAFYFKEILIVLPTAVG
jgi:hypothetical protein